MNDGSKQLWVVALYTGSIEAPGVTKLAVNITKGGMSED